MTDDVPRLAQQITNGEVDAEDCAGAVADWTPIRRKALIDLLLDESSGRRWLRGSLMPNLPSDETSVLAGELRGYEDDFGADRRDSTTAAVVNALPLDDLSASVTFFAAGNAAGAFWSRIARECPAAIPELIERVLQAAGPAARETTLSMLLLDPYSNVQLTGPARRDVLCQALDDDDPHVRGIAADLLADESPEPLIQQWDRLVMDSSERVRVATWDAVFVTNFERSRQRAFDLVLDESATLEARRTALSALSAVLSTDQIAPLLESLVTHINPTLAEDAVNLLWRYHRSPVIATAAASSPHESVRAVAERLLHPQTGSPAAGGSRPGAPTGARNIYQEMLKGYERRDAKI